MSDPDSDMHDDMSPELWEIERRYMTFAAFDDLTRAVTGLDHEGRLFQPTPKYISDGFYLLASGLGQDPADFAENVSEFLAALNAGAEQQSALLRAALDRLTGQLGFTPEAPEVIATFKLSGED